MREENLSRLNKIQTNFNDPYYLVYLYLFESLRHASQYANGKLLDIGCGNKPYQELFAKVNEHFGCDIVQSNEKKVDLLCDVTSIPIADNSFDTVLSTQVIEHVADPQTLCDEAFRLLRENGYFIVSGPMYWHLHEEPYDFHRFTKYGFKKILENSGFEVVEILPNGGKWAMLGLVAIHTFTGTRLYRSVIIRTINRFCAWLDKKRFDAINTSNYVVIAKK